MEAKDKRRWVWMLATGAAVAGGAYLLYNAWSLVRAEELDAEVGKLMRLIEESAG